MPRAAGQQHGDGIIVLEIKYLSMPLAPVTQRAAPEVEMLLLACSDSRGFEWPPLNEESLAMKPNIRGRRSTGEGGEASRVRVQQVH